VSTDKNGELLPQRNRALRAQRLRAARLKGTHTANQWALLKTACGDRCVRCGAAGLVERDHIKPLYQGGSDGIENIQPLCPRCNASKGPESVDHRPVGWLAIVGTA
jgi:5-methylcytosine-specific restriction endonuclease McrA